MRKWVIVLMSAKELTWVHDTSWCMVSRGIPMFPIFVRMSLCWSADWVCWSPGWISSFVWTWWMSMFRTLSHHRRTGSGMVQRGSTSSRQRMLSVRWVNTISGRVAWTRTLTWWPVSFLKSSLWGVQSRLSRIFLAWDLTELFQIIFSVWFRTRARPPRHRPFWHYSFLLRSGDFLLRSGDFLLRQRSLLLRYEAMSFVFFRFLYVTIQYRMIPDTRIRISCFWYVSCCSLTFKCWAPYRTP